MNMLCVQVVRSEEKTVPKVEPRPLSPSPPPPPQFDDDGGDWGGDWEAMTGEGVTVKEEDIEEMETETKPVV